MGIFKKLWDAFTAEPPRRIRSAEHPNGGGYWACYDDGSVEAISEEEYVRLLNEIAIEDELEEW